MPRCIRHSLFAFVLRMPIQIYSTTDSMFVWKMLARVWLNVYSPNKTRQNGFRMIHYNNCSGMNFGRKLTPQRMNDLLNYLGRTLSPEPPRLLRRWCNGGGVGGQARVQLAKKANNVLVQGLESYWCTHSYGQYWCMWMRRRKTKRYRKRECVCGKWMNQNEWMNENACE